MDFDHNKYYYENRAKSTIIKAKLKSFSGFGELYEVTLNIKNCLN